MVLNPQDRTRLKERVRPVSLAGERVLEVAPFLADILPDQGLRRGTTIAIGGGDPAGGVGPGASGSVVSSLALGLVAPASTSGSWVAAVDLPTLGLAAAGELGVALARLVLVGPVPGPQWAATVVALVEALDVVLVGPPSGAVPAGLARRIQARGRERGAVLVLVGWPSARWPDRPELTLQARPLEWAGIGWGHGHLQARQVELTVSGRHGAARGRQVRLWLPDEQGRLAPVEPDEAVIELPGWRSSPLPQTGAHPVHSTHSAHSAHSVRPARPARSVRSA
ncbi:MAG: hypothetical protein ACKV2O_01885 [Acidimicrobiales bacterium]